MGPQERTNTEQPLESMEYIPANSAVYREWLQWQPHNRVWDRWLVMALIGMSVGLTSFLLQKFIEILFSIRSQLGHFFIAQEAVWGYLLAWFCYVVLSAVAAVVAALLVIKVAPAASASGVPQIMAFLNGIHIPKLLNVWTFVVKFLSCSFVVAAGLPVGPEGPLIHMGAILGSAMSGLHSTTMHFDLGIFRHLRGTKHKRDFVTAGVAAGVAAAFDAPIGGLLFAFEEVASFWHSHLGWQVFFCCTVAVLVQVWHALMLCALLIFSLNLIPHCSIFSAFQLLLLGSIMPCRSDSLIFL
jgi:chloride channel 7